MLSFFPLDVLVEIWDVIESEGFLTYSLYRIYAIRRMNVTVTSIRHYVPADINTFVIVIPTYYQYLAYFVSVLILQAMLSQRMCLAV